MIRPGEVFLFRRTGWVRLCAECGKGIDAKDSDKLLRREGRGWEPNRWEQAILAAFDDGPLELSAIAVRTRMHPGKVRGLLGHLQARQRVERNGNGRWRKLA